MVVRDDAGPVRDVGSGPFCSLKYIGLGGGGAVQAVGGQYQHAEHERGEDRAAAVLFPVFPVQLVQGEHRHGQEHQGQGQGVP